MLNFQGKFIKDLNSFGVSGVLTKDAEIIYNTFFTTAHIGKVSDVLTARLKSLKIDEFKIRHFIVLCVMQAYQAQFLKKKKLKFFSKKEDLSLDEPILLECGLDAEKIALGVSFNLSLNFFLNTEGLSERILNKAPNDFFEEVLLYLEKFSDQLILKFHPETRRTEIISLISIAVVETKKERKLVEIVTIAKETLKHAPLPKSYIDLGEVQVDKILPSDKREIFNQTKPLEEKIIQGEAQTAEEETVLRGNAEDLNDQSKIVFSGDAEKHEESHTFLGTANKVFKNFIGKLTVGSSSKSKLNQLSDNASEGEILRHFDYITSTENLKDAQKKFGNVLKAYQDPKVSEWFDSFVSSLVQEKHQISDLKKKLLAHFKSREYEFNQKMAYMKQDMLKLELQLKQKEDLLEHTKSQLAGVSRNMDRMKILNQDILEDEEYKKKYEIAQKSISHLKEENLVLKKKLEEAKFKNQNDSSVEVSEEFEQMKLKYEKIFRQYEDLKKANRQIVTQLGDTMRDKNPQNSGGNEELKRRLEAAMKLAMAHKKESDAFKSLLVRSRQREDELIAEIERLKK